MTTKTYYNVVIADTSCLIVLDKIGQLDLLYHLFHHIYITPQIADEYNGLFTQVDKYTIGKKYQLF